MRSNCYLRASGQNSDTAVVFTNPDFPKESNNLVIRWRLLKIAIYFYFWSIWPNDLEHVPHVALRTGIIFYQVRSTYPFLIYNVFTADKLRHVVTLTFDPLTVNVCRRTVQEIAVAESNA